jgi:hypothetical protein
MKRNFSLIIAFFALLSAATAQVNIGSNDEPEEFSVLQLTGTDGGLRVNQLDSAQISALASSIKASGKISAAQGLLVYNTTEGCYNMFKDEAFQSLCANSSQATFDTDSILICGSLGIYGKYQEGQSLTQENYLTLDVLCTKAGAYSFTGIIRNSDGPNGYAFSKTGELLESGRHTLIIYGSGTPLHPHLDSLSISINQSHYFCSNGLISVEPAPQRAVFRIDSVAQIGHHFVTNVNYNNSETNALKATIKVSQGGVQTELTAMVNGLEFKYTPEENTYWDGPTGFLNTTYFCDGSQTNIPGECKGNLTTTQTLVGDTAAVSHEVTLKCSGNPTSYGWFQGSVRGKSGKSGEIVHSPSVNLLFLSRKIRILGASSGMYNIAHQAANENLPYQMLNQLGNYIYKDAGNPGQYIEGFTFTETSGIPTDDQLKNADIVNFGYNIHPGNNTTLVNFVKNKQIVLLFSGQDAPIVDASMIKAITDENVTINANGGGGTVYQFIDIANDPIIYGHFGSLAGKYMGEDGGTNHRITSPIPARFVTYSLNEAYPNCIRDNELGFIWMGDGGSVSNYFNSNSTTSYPFNIDRNKLPAPQTYYIQPVWNSLFIANAVWWSIDFLRKNGKID